MSEAKGDKGTSATPSKKVLAASVKKAGTPYKSFHVSSAESFSSRCVAHRHCLVVLTNSSWEGAASTAATRALAGLAEGVAGASRLLRVAVVDGATFDFSLTKALPAAALWPSAAGPHPFSAPRILYLRSLSSKEKTAVSAAHAPAPPPAVLPDARGEATKLPAVSRVARTAIVSANAEAAAAAFEAKRVTPRQWAGLDASAVKAEDLVFAIDGVYYSWAAAAPWLIGSSVFGSPPSEADMKALAQKHPLVQPPAAKWAAKAFRDAFSLRALKEWAAAMVATDVQERGTALALLPSAPKIASKKAAKDKPAQKKNPKTKAPTKQANPSAEKAPESGVAARKRRLAEKADAAERASRESEARRRMDAENDEFVPQSADEEVEVGADGEPVRWDDDEEDDDDESWTEASEGEMLLL
jgi:hypothetical protein